MSDKTKKKICLLLYSLSGGGEERIASILSAELSGLYDVHAVLFNGPIDYSISNDIKVKILRRTYRSRLIRLATLPLVIWRYYCYCKKNKVVLSLSFDTMPNFVNCIVGLFEGDMKIWLREVNYVSLRYKARTLQGRIHRSLISLLYPTAHRIYVNARRIMDDLIANYNIRSGLFEIMPNPIDIDLITKSATASKSLRFAFVHVASFSPAKNHELLIEAFAASDLNDAELWLVGKGSLMSRIKTMVEDLHLKNRVQFLGFQTNPFQYMAAARCMVLSSNYEGLPNVLLEGMALGLPLIATDCFSGPREVIAPSTIGKNVCLKDRVEIGDCGLLVPVSNTAILSKALEMMYKNAALRQKLGARSLSLVQEYSKNNVVKTVIAQIEKDLS